LFFAFSCSGQVIFEDDFDTVLDSRLWKIETLAGGRAHVADGHLVLDTRAGMTVWLNHELTGDYKIIYQRTVLLDSGVNDRLSDFNQFWMADAAPFTR